MINLRSFGQLISLGTISIQMKMGNSFAICCVITHVMLCKQIHEIIASIMQSDFDDIFDQITKYRSFGQLISLGPSSIQIKLGKTITICYITTHVMLCNQIHGIIASHFHSEFDNTFDQKTKKMSFGQLISSGK